MVGYGGSYNTSAKPVFDRLARAGSCKSPGNYWDVTDPYTFEPLTDKTGCERTIGADTPEDLKTEIGSKIRQIIAERLSFSAPSITATLEEGGSIYQAQFTYEANGEWTGHLLRKSIVDGEVKHDTYHQIHLVTGMLHVQLKLKNQLVEIFGQQLIPILILTQIILGTGTIGTRIMLYQYRNCLKQQVTL